MLNLALALWILNIELLAGILLALQPSVAHCGVCFPLLHVTCQLWQWADERQGVALLSTFNCLATRPKTASVIVHPNKFIASYFHVIVHQEALMICFSWPKLTAKQINEFASFLDNKLFQNSGSWKWDVWGGTNSPHPCAHQQNCSWIFAHSGCWDHI